MLEGLYLCGPRASVTENKQYVPVIRALLRPTKSPVLRGFMPDKWVQ